MSGHEADIVPKDGAFTEWKVNGEAMAVDFETFRNQQIVPLDKIKEGKSAELAYLILNSSSQGFLDWVRRHTTSKEKMIAETIKMLAEVEAIQIQNSVQLLRGDLALRIAEGKYADEAEKQNLLDALQSL